MVTSFRPRSPFVRNDTVLTNVRPSSNLSELYFQYAEYRLANTAVRIAAELEHIRAAHAAGRRTDVGRLKAFLRAESAGLEGMDAQIVEEADVDMAVIDPSQSAGEKDARG